MGPGRRMRFHALHCLWSFRRATDCSHAPGAGNKTRSGRSTHIGLAAVALATIFHPGQLARAAQPPGSSMIPPPSLFLSLHLTGASFPRGALIWATVRAENRSDQVLHLFDGPPDLYPALGVQVVSSDGRVRYPPPVSGVIALPGSESSVLSLKPHTLLSQRHLVILSFARLRPTARLETRNGREFDVMGAAPTLHLAESARPRVTIYHAGSTVFAVIRPVTQVVGPLLYFYSATCQIAGSAPMFTSSQSWSRVPARRITPGCGAVHVWRAVAGWVGAPVARIVYRGGGPPTRVRVEQGELVPMSRVRSAPRFFL